MPMQSNKNIHNETSLVDLVFHVLITCGRKDMVVNMPPKKPNNVVESI